MENQKEYELSDLCADDIFLLVNVIKKVGISNFADVVSKRQNKETKKEQSVLGLQFANLIIDRLTECKNELYAFLASLSGKTSEEIAKLDAIVFIEMIYDVIEKPKFKDFIGVAFKFAK